MLSLIRSLAAELTPAWLAQPPKPTPDPMPRPDPAPDPGPNPERPGPPPIPTRGYRAYRPKPRRVDWQSEQ